MAEQKSMICTAFSGPVSMGTAGIRRWNIICSLRHSRLNKPGYFRSRIPALDPVRGDAG